MTKLFTKNYFLLGASLLLASCGAASVNGNTSTQSYTRSNNSPLFATSIIPASGTLSTLPTSIVVNFSEAITNASAAASAYIINCGGYDIAAASTLYTPGSNNITVTLPNLGALASGTVCNFVLAQNISDSNGNTINGTNYTSYKIVP